jgi:signal transduction histidine kinase/CheY-like chemotaxis protein/HPt (histidine-containing phosphotransfer) domain-containing protein
MHGLPLSEGEGRVVASDDGTVMAFSAAGGSCMRHGAERFEAIAGFPKREIAAVANIDGWGNTWVVHARTEGNPACLARISMENTHAVWQPHSAEGLWSVGTPRCIFAERSGGAGTSLWIGGTLGILHHAIAAGPQAPVPQPPLVRAFAKNAEHDTPTTITGVLPYATRSVLFEFAAPEFSRRPGLRIESFVEGVDREWLPAGPEARRVLTAMRDGSYVLHVRTVAETGAISTPVLLPFTIAPPWWRTAPACGGALLVFATAAMGAFRFRVRVLRQQNAALEEKVRQRTAQLALANAAKTQFVANMSHDIRNPLNGIVGLTYALEDTTLNRQQGEIVKTLRECTGYLSSLVDEVLDFSSIEAGKVELKIGSFDPSVLLSSVAAMLKAEADRLGAVVAVDVGANVPPVLRGDAGRIQRVLVNFVSNALKYAGGQIRLSVDRPRNSTDEIEFAVADHGPGLSAADQAQLFTLFFRLPGAQREGVPGTGLGLASCRLLADAMGGSVGVQSNPDTGSRFFLRLPLEIGRVESTVALPAMPNVKVLLVEDTDYNAAAAAAVLAKLGLVCERARNGAEALRLFSEKRFQVVLLDRNLPDLDGTEVARRIRELEAGESPALILAVTAYCTSQDRDLCLAAGMDAFVGKPLTPEKLREVFAAAARRLLSATSVQTPPESPPEDIDLGLLNFLSDGNEEDLKVQIGRFLEVLAETEPQVRAAARSGDFPALGDTAHLLLSQAKMVGHRGLTDAAQRLERAARETNTAAIERLEAQSLHEIEQLRGAISRRAPTKHLV